MSAPPARPGRWRWLDLRLVPVAGTVWGTTLLAPELPVPALAAMAGTAAVVGVLLARRRSAATGVAALVLLAVAVTGACAAVRGAVRESSPLRAATVAGRVVVAVLEVDGDPQPVTGAAGPARVVVDATVLGVELPDRSVVLRDPVVVFGPEQDWSAVLPGEQLRVRVAVGPAAAADDVAAVLSARAPPARLAGPGWLQSTAGAVRDSFAGAARQDLGDEVGGLLPGLVLGDTRGLDPLLAADFRAAGLTHLVAVSGANLAIVLAGVLWPMRRRAVDRRVQAVVAVLALAALVVLVRPGPSVLRAAAMGLVSIAGLAAGRPRAAVPALAAAVAVLVLVRPALAGDVGFTLSVAATAGIVLLAPRWSAALRRHRCPALLADALAVTAAAGLVTAPAVAGISGQVPLVSLPANLLAAPAVAPATVLGLVAALLAPWAGGPAGVVLWVAGWPVRWLVAVAQRAAAVPDTAAPWPAGWRGALLLGLLVLLAGLALWRWQRLRWLALAALVGLVVVGWPVRQAVRTWPPAAADLVACDVGQGDALVVPTAPGQAVLVDVGPDPALEDACLRRLGITDVPLVLLSHLDADHVTGLAGALAGRHVGMVATAVLAPSDHRVGRIDQLARRSGAARSTLLPGYRRTVGTATLEVLAPPEESATAAAQPNDLCMLVRLTQRGLRLLLTGDLNEEAERRILDRGVDVRADVLKVPHHGSADADPDFLAATGARVALVSVGAGNRYGHPAARTLDALGRDGMQVHRTDGEGDLAVVGSADGWGVAATRSGPRPPGTVARAWQHAVVPAAAPPPTSRLRVISGEEELLRSRAVAAVRAAVHERHPGTEEHELVAAGLPVGQLADVLAPSLFGGHRLVVVTGVQEAAGALADALTGYAKDPDPELTLVLVHFGGKRNEALVKAFTAAGAALDECPRLKSTGDLIGFVRNEVRGLGGRIAPEAVTALVDAVGNDLRQLSAAASQLVSDFGASIDADMVARFHRGQAEVSGFDVAERTLVGDRAGSLETLRWALERGVAHVLIADALADGVRTAARVAALNTSDVGDLARVLKLPPWKVRKAQAQSRGWSIDGLQKAIGVAADLNADVKGAAASPDYALERAVRRIVAIRADSARGRQARAGR